MTPRQEVDPESRSAAYRAAIRLLEHRDRSRQDLQDRLGKKGFSTETIEETVSRLQREGFVDDTRFAARYVESVRGSRGHGATRLRQDLIRRGISAELAKEATSVDPAAERELAYELAVKRVARIAPDTPREAALRRVAGYLGRKGFPPDAVWTAVKRALDERA